MLNVHNRIVAIILAITLMYMYAVIDTLDTATGNEEKSAAVYMETEKD